MLSMIIRWWLKGVQEVRNFSTDKKLLSVISSLSQVFCLSAVKTLRLSRRRPSTAWGVQKKLFRQEEEYFRSREGTYQFEYDTGNVQNQMFRREKRYPDGTVVGFYGYIDPEGVLRITEYVAGRLGFKQRTVLRYPV